MNLGAGSSIHFHPHQTLPIQHAQLLDKSAHDLVTDLNMGQYILVNELLSQVRVRAKGKQRRGGEKMTADSEQHCS